jgi:hypothetical protein
LGDEARFGGAPEMPRIMEREQILELLQRRQIGCHRVALFIGKIDQ